jgi:hypothetical protein
VLGRLLQQPPEHTTRHSPPRLPLGPVPAGLEESAATAARNVMLAMAAPEHVTDDATLAPLTRCALGEALDLIAGASVTT